MEKSPLLRRAFIWNTLAAVTNACMSFLMTLVTMQLCGAEAGGIFSIAFSSAQMLQTVALFGMRNFQVTDISFQFQFKEYISSRVITSLVMAIVCGLYAGVMGFKGEKLTIYLLFCGVKLFEALADVLEGMLHQRNRLDCAAQGLFLRSLFIIVFFVIALLMGAPLLTASWVAFLTSVLGFVLCSWPMARKFDTLAVSPDLFRIGKLLLQCLPLFIVSAAGSYINNAPKIAIELYVGDQAQAQFAIVFMPTFVINLVSGFIFRPLVNTMADCFISQKKYQFVKLIRLMALLVFGITLAALTGTWFLGVPVLSWIYGVDIAGQKDVLLLLILSGGFCAIVGLLCQVLVVMRRQTHILIDYLVTVILVLTASNYLAGTYGMMGAACLYFLSMALLAFLLAISYVRYMRRAFL